jgi:1-acyl-sn-glycerol-3-phosphate acyltransferase
LKVLKFIWSFYVLLIVAVPFLITYPILYIFLSREKWYPLGHKYRIVWGWFITTLSGLRQKITIEQELGDGPFVIVSNHTSYLDIISTTCGIPVYFNYMAKIELAKIPLFGIFFRTIDIAVNRKSVRDSVKSYQEAIKRLQNGISIMVFPEGTIGKQVPNLRKFKPGAFKMAIENKVPILPITILDNYKRLPDGSIFFGSPGKMRIHIHRPIEVDNLKIEDQEELKNRVYTIIENKLIQENIIGNENNG